MYQGTADTMQILISTRTVFSLLLNGQWWLKIKNLALQSSLVIKYCDVCGKCFYWQIKDPHQSGI